MKSNIISNVILEKALSQIDKIGYELAIRGITAKVNRHTAIANAMMQKNRLEGELERAKLRYELTRNQVQKIRVKVDDNIDIVIDKLPTPIAKPARRLHTKVRQPKQVANKN